MLKEMLKEICKGTWFWRVWPLNVYLKDCKSQWMSQFILINDQGAPATALHVDAGERVQLRVYPVEPLGQQIWAEKEG